MHPEINPEVTHDDLKAVPIPHKVSEPLSSVTIKADMPSPSPLPGDSSANECGDPNCRFCRWVPIIDEVMENLTETDVFERMVESGYPTGFSLGLLPTRITEAHSASMMELVDGMEQSIAEGKHVMIPASRVPDMLDTLKSHLEESDDLITLTVINDRMLLAAVGMLGIMLDPQATADQRAAAQRWYTNITGSKSPKA